MKTLPYLLYFEYFSVKNMGRAISYWISDALFRLKSKYLRVTGKVFEFSNHKDKSDSEIRPYLQFIERAAVFPEVGLNFRRDLRYREILEHVGYFLGAKYLKQINSVGSFYKDQLKKSALNDSYGNPRTFRLFDGIELSTTTIRYLSVWYQIESLVKPLPNSKWVEIGCGYGGQAAVLNRMISIQSYTMFDVPQAKNLITQYLTNINSGLTPIFANLSEFNHETSYDFAISNYAFSELPRQLQVEYLTKVLSKSRHGYMIMNSGRSNFSGRSKGKLTLGEIQAFLPQLKVLEEKPLSGPDNYLIVW